MSHSIANWNKHPNNSVLIGYNFRIIAVSLLIPFDIVGSHWAYVMNIRVNTVIDLRKTTRNSFDAHRRRHQY